MVLFKEKYIQTLSQIITIACEKETNNRRSLTLMK